MMTQANPFPATSPLREADREGKDNAAFAAMAVELLPFL